MSSLIRINKLLSQAGIASRRKADLLIEEGAVMLNGKVLTKPGILVDTEKDRVWVNGKELELKKRRTFLYFVLNKPKGYICTASDTHKRRTVMDLFEKNRGLFTVGRLDKDTTGIIVITNDGELGHRLMHPSFEIEKIYRVSIKGCLTERDISKLGKGVDIGEKRPSLLEVLRLTGYKDSTTLLVKMHEGKKRQIRRTFEALGYIVTSLKRTSYGGIKIDTKEGNFRKLTDGEVKLLKKQVNLV